MTWTRWSIASVLRARVTAIARACSPKGEPSRGTTICRNMVRLLHQGQGKELAYTGATAVPERNWPEQEGVSGKVRPNRTGASGAVSVPPQGARVRDPGLWYGTPSGYVRDAAPTPKGLNTRAQGRVLAHPGLGRS